VIAALLLATAASGASAPAQAAEARVDAPEMVLARVYGSEEMLGGGDFAAQMRAELDEQLRPQLSAQEARWPGVTWAVTSELQPLVQEIMRRRLPDLWRRLAPVFRSALTADELRRAAAFVGSPAGRAVAAATLALGPSEDDGDEAALVAALPEEHRAAWIAHRDGEAGRKLRGTGEALNDATARWAEAAVPAITAEAERAAERVLAQYRTGKRS